MKIQILSDVHNEFGTLPLPHTDADVVVLAGDIDTHMNSIPWIKEFNKPVIYILGNHEYYGDDFNGLKESAERLLIPPIYFLEGSSVILDGVRFVGGTLWTDFQLFGDEETSPAIRMADMSMNDYRLIGAPGGKRFLEVRDTIDRHLQTKAAIQKVLDEEFNGKTVVVSHHLPSKLSVPDFFKEDLLSAAYASHLDDMMGPKIDLWIHGHTHTSFDYNINGTRVICNPRGYQGYELNPEFNPTLVVEI